MSEEVYCSHADKRQSFLQADLSFWVYLAKHAQSNQNKKFVISLQYLKENVKDEVNFLHADKHRMFLQIDTIILSVCVTRQHPQVSQNDNFAIF